MFREVRAELNDLEQRVYVVNLDGLPAGRHHPGLGPTGPELTRLLNSLVHVAQRRQKRLVILDTFLVFDDELAVQVPQLAVHSLHRLPILEDPRILRANHEVFDRDTRVRHVCHQSGPQRVVLVYPRQSLTQSLHVVREIRRALDVAQTQRLGHVLNHLAAGVHVVALHQHVAPFVPGVDGSNTKRLGVSQTDHVASTLLRVIVHLAGRLQHERVVDPSGDFHYALRDAHLHRRCRSLRQRLEWNVHAEPGQTELNLEHVVRRAGAR